MRILTLLPNGDLQLKYFRNVIPQYAILSHTWRDETEEVTFEDIVEESNQTKVGYEKIKFCGEQAAKDGFQYFWVDSCCIKKSSDSELSESINSMFRWYQRAAKCYVYLEDVSMPELDSAAEKTQAAWEQAFRNSRWFKRGWTLQELLAPSSVEFFTKEGTKLGDKKSLAQWIHEITRIPVLALKGTALYNFSTEQKLEWATGRMTTLEEDEAYCLLGIFDISMPVIYGEGREKASRRLKKEIDDAPKHMASLFASGGKSFVATSTDSSDFIFFYNVEHNLTMSVRSKGGAFSTKLVQVNGETIRGKETYANQLAATSHHTNYIGVFYVDNASGLLSDLFTHDNGRTFKAGNLDTQGVIPTATGSLTATSNSQRPGVSIFLIDAADSRCVTEAIWNNGWSANCH